jgi:hypothetical protein
MAEVIYIKLTQSLKAKIGQMVFGVYVKRNNKNITVLIVENSSALQKAAQIIDNLKTERHNVY